MSVPRPAVPGRQPHPPFAAIAMRNIRLFWQIFPVFAGITLLTVVLVGWLATATGREFFISHLKEEIKNQALLLEPTISAFSLGPQEKLEEFIRQSGRRTVIRITVVDRDGVVLADSDEDRALMDNHGQRPEVAAALNGEPGYSFRKSRTIGDNLLYAAIPVKLGEDRRRGALRLAVHATALDRVLAALHERMLGIGAAVTVLAGLLSLFWARRISLPLEEMKRGAEQLTKGRIDQLGSIRHDHMSAEMAGLAASINAMAGEINQRVKIIIQQRNELEAVFSAMADAVIAIDADRKIIRMNQAAAALFSLSPESVKGKAALGVIRNTYLLELIEYTLAQNTAQEQRTTLFNGTEPIILQTHAMPLRDEANRNMGVLLVMNDLTRLNRLENIRQDFVANVSHELRTPITAIKGYVETLQDGAIEDLDTGRRFLAIIARQASRLDAIVEDLLTLSRIEDKNGNHEITLTPAPVAPVLEAALQTCAVQADEKEIAVRIEGDDNLIAPINQPLLEQAVINLLKNAIAYSPRGARITLGAAAATNLEGEEFVHLSVADTGPGIAREHLPRLFERFYRCDKARSRDQGGTGLGLAIVKHIAQSHHGTVEVDSTLGKGSTFTIILPRARIE